MWGLPEEVADMVRKHQRVIEAELKAWRERHPREAASVHEEALAKVERRKPNYGPHQAYG